MSFSYFRKHALSVSIGYLNCRKGCKNPEARQYIQVAIKPFTTHGCRVYCKVQMLHSLSSAAILELASVARRQLVHCDSSIKLLRPDLVELEVFGVDTIEGYSSRGVRLRSVEWPLSHTYTTHDVDLELVRTN